MVYIPYATIVSNVGNFILYYTHPQALFTFNMTEKLSIMGGTIVFKTVSSSES